MDPRDRLAFRITTLSNMLQRWASRGFAGRLDIHLMDWRILSGLRHTGPATASELCDFAVMDRGNASRVITRLLERRLVRRRADGADGRKNILALEPKGRRLCDRAGSFIDQRESRLMNALSATERKQLVKILGELETEARAMLEEN